MPESDEYASSTSRAEEVLKLARLYEVPPNPVVFEVFYHYLENSDGLVAKSIDSLINDVGCIRFDDLKRIHDEFIATENKTFTQSDKASAEVEIEMDKVLDLINYYLSSSEQTSGVLGQSKDEIRSADPKRVVEIIEKVISENLKLQSETKVLMSNLETSRAQIHKVRTELVQTREKSNRDPLTNVGNRRQFDMNLAVEIAKARSSARPLSLVLADLDHFKQVNDTFGHLIGDEVLKYFASMLVKNLKGSDVVTRYGGEEFAIILPNTEASEAATVIEKIRAKFETSKLFVTKNKAPIGHLTASFGIAQFTSHEDAESLIDRADKNLYLAKESGRNRIEADGKSLAA